jgi:hypothetical protein
MSFLLRYLWLDHGSWCALMLSTSTVCGHHTKLASFMLRNLERPGTYVDLSGSDAAIRSWQRFQARLDPYLVPGLLPSTWTYCCPIRLAGQRRSGVSPMVTHLSPVVTQLAHGSARTSAIISIAVLIPPRPRPPPSSAALVFLPTSLIAQLLLTTFPVCLLA